MKKNILKISILLVVVVIFLINIQSDLLIERKLYEQIQLASVSFQEYSIDGKNEEFVKAKDGIKNAIIIIRSNESFWKEYREEEKILDKFYVLISGKGSLEGEDSLELSNLLSAIVNQKNDDKNEEMNTWIQLNNLFLEIDHRYIDKNESINKPIDKWQRSKSA